MARPHSTPSHRQAGGDPSQSTGPNREDSRRPEDVADTDAAGHGDDSSSQPEGDTDDWGFSDKKPGMATETKIGFALILVLIAALSLVVFRKLNHKSEGDDGRYAVTVDGAATADGQGEAADDAATSVADSGTFEPADGMAPAQAEPGILAEPASYQTATSPVQPAAGDNWNTSGQTVQQDYAPAGGQAVAASEGFEPAGTFQPAAATQAGVTAQTAAATTTAYGPEGGVADPFGNEPGVTAAGASTTVQQPPAGVQDQVFADQFEPVPQQPAATAQPAGTGFGDDEFFPAETVATEQAAQSPVRQAAGFEQQDPGAAADPFGNADQAQGVPSEAAVQTEPADDEFFPATEPAGTAPAAANDNPFEATDDIAAEAAAAAAAGQTAARPAPAEAVEPFEDFAPVDPEVAEERYERAPGTVPAGAMTQGEFDPGPPADRGVSPLEEVSSPQELPQRTTQVIPPAAGAGSVAGEFVPQQTGGGFDAVASAPVAGDRVHEVRASENYWSISRQYYGVPGYFQALAHYNAGRIRDPRKMRPGMKVLVPSADVLHQRFPQICPKGRVAARQTAQPEQPEFFIGEDGVPRCRVGSGDTLSHVSRRHLGRASRWIQVYELNRDQLKSPTALRTGMILRLPADASRVQLLQSRAYRR